MSELVMLLLFYSLLGLGVACVVFRLVNYMILTDNEIETSLLQLIASLVDLKDLADEKESILLKVFYYCYCCVLFLFVIMIAVWLFIVIFRV
jgi:hypothetical protein